MSERQTGATPEQIERAVTSLAPSQPSGRLGASIYIDKAVAHLVLPTARIVEDWPAVAAALRRVHRLADAALWATSEHGYEQQLNDAAMDLEPGDLDRLAALIGDDDG